VREIGLSLDGQPIHHNTSYLQLQMVLTEMKFHDSLIRWKLEEFSACRSERTRGPFPKALLPFVVSTNSHLSLNLFDILFPESEFSEIRKMTPLTKGGRP
jgi:hypothetical protein